MTGVLPNTVEIVSGGVASPEGFQATGIFSGIKVHGLDLALIVSERSAAAAAVFTTNRAQAAPVLVSREHLTRSQGQARAIIVNSGCANACTGEAGLEAARDMASETARLVGCDTDEVLVASTGVIGVTLPIDKVLRALPEAVRQLAAGSGSAAAQAIMTTDPFPKEAATRLEIGGSTITIGGMAKGSGMIEPSMATMLAFITTDAAIKVSVLEKALREAVNNTFNAITVDGECSTNDCVMVMANGSSGIAIEEQDYGRFEYALEAVCLRLALGIVRGGEGATKLVTVSVTGAAAVSEARRAAKAIANSLLVKTAIHGGDPNWGRVVAVVGRSGVQFDLDRTSVSLGPVVLFSRGQPHDEGTSEAAEYLNNRDVLINVDLGVGPASSTVWTCDLSADYVRINADYRT